MDEEEEETCIYRPSLLACEGAGYIAAGQGFLLITFLGDLE